jgi:hypothetical protein
MNRNPRANTVQDERGFAVARFDEIRARRDEILAEEQSEMPLPAAPPRADGDTSINTELERIAAACPWARDAIRFGYYPGYTPG